MGVPICTRGSAVLNGDIAGIKRTIELDWDSCKNKTCPKGKSMCEVALVQDQVPVTVKPFTLVHIVVPPKTIVIFKRKILRWNIDIEIKKGLLLDLKIDVKLNGKVNFELATWGCS